MARGFNGSSDIASASYTIGSPVGISFTVVAGWFWRDTNTANQIIWEFGNTVSIGFDVVQAAIAGPADLVRSYKGASSFADSYPSPSTGVWHHFVWGISFGGTGGLNNHVYIDGVAQTLTSQGHTAFTPASSTDAFTLGGRLTSGVASAWWQGRVAEMAYWTPGTGGAMITAGQVAALYSGAPPAFVYPEAIVGYWPLLGDTSPEPNYTQGQESFSLTGTTVQHHPGVQSLLQAVG